MKGINWDKISPKQFENLCFDLIEALGFNKIYWREGGADSGRDIEAGLRIIEPDGNDEYQLWFFECKLYKKGIPVREIQEKIAKAIEKEGYDAWKTIIG